MREEVEEVTGSAFALSQRRGSARFPVLSGLNRPARDETDPVSRSPRRAKRERAVLAVMNTGTAEQSARGLES